MSDQISAQIQYSQFFKGRSGLTIGITDVIYSHRTPYQHIQVCDTDALGRMMLLDGIVMFTEHDEFVYHEMLAHTASCLLGNPKTALIIGGGDGGTARELLRYKTITRIDLVEIDKEVINASKEFFPTLSSGFGDSRLTIHANDGIEFVQHAPAQRYDLIIIDGTDPIGFGAGLYEKAFYQNCSRLLTARGVFLTLSESPFDPTYRDMVGRVRHDLRAVFPIAETFIAYIPTYQTGMFSFAFASKKLHPIKNYNSRKAAQLLKPFAAQLKYYNPEIHLAAFALPNFVKRLVTP